MDKIYENNPSQSSQGDSPKSYGEDIKKEALKLLKNIRFVMKSGVMNTAFQMPEAPKKMEFLLKDANMPKQFTNGKTDAEGERPMYRQPKEVVEETKDIAERLFSKFDINKFYQYLNESSDPYLDDFVIGHMLNEEFEFDNDAQSLEMLIRDYVQASATAVCTMLGRVTGQTSKELLDTLNDWARYTDPDIEGYVEQQRRRDINSSKGAQARFENVSAYYKYVAYISYLRLLASTNGGANVSTTSNAQAGVDVQTVNDELKNNQVEKLLEEFRNGKLGSTKVIREHLEKIHQKIMSGGANAVNEKDLAKSAGVDYLSIPDEYTYKKETEDDSTIDADKIFNDVKTSITKSLNGALSTDPGTWATVKLFEQSGNELIKAATEEITTRIKVICNVDKAKKLTPKVPLQQSGLINLWKRYEQELVRRQHDRVNQFTTSGSVEFFKDFMSVTVPNVFSAMIVFRNVVYGLQHSVNPESVKQLEEILEGVAKNKRLEKERRIDSKLQSGQNPFENGDTINLNYKVGETNFTYNSSNANDPLNGRGMFRDTIKGNFSAGGYSGGEDYPYEIFYMADWNDDGTVTFYVWVTTDAPDLETPQLSNQSGDILRDFSFNNGVYICKTFDTYTQGDEGEFAIKFEFGLNEGLPIEYHPGKVTEWTKHFGLAVKWFNDFYNSHNMQSQDKVLTKFSEELNAMWQALGKVAKLPQADLPQPEHGDFETERNKGNIMLERMYKYMTGWVKIIAGLKSTNESETSYEDYVVGVYRRMLLEDDNIRTDNNQNQHQQRNPLYRNPHADDLDVVAGGGYANTQDYHRKEKPFTAKSPEYVAFMEMYTVAKNRYNKSEKNAKNDIDGKDRYSNEETGNTGSATSEGVVYYYKGDVIRL